MRTVRALLLWMTMALALMGAKASDFYDQGKLMNFYRILGVAPNASPEEIKRAYRKLSMENHPDRVGEQGTARQILLNRAYDVLKDGEARKGYDEIYRRTVAAARAQAKPQTSPGTFRSQPKASDRGAGGPGPGWTGSARRASNADASAWANAKPFRFEEFRDPDPGPRAQAQPRPEPKPGPVRPSRMTVDQISAALAEASMQNGPEKEAIVARMEPHIRALTPEERAQVPERVRSAREAIRAYQSVSENCARRFGTLFDSFE